MARAIENLLDEETLPLRAESEAELASFYQVATPAEYHRFLGRWYGFIAPLERSVLDTTEIELVIDPRRFGKRLLLEHDLQASGMKLIEIQSLPQCMWIPWFEDVYTALGWAYVVERNAQTFPSLFRHLASTLPGEAAFGATFLKCYASGSGEMWASFVRGLARARRQQQHLDSVVAGAKAGYRFFRRWRSTLDGKGLSGNGPADDQAPDVPARDPQANAREEPSIAPAEES
ncbi:MAG: biliverdin-producing heme oxygenase [Deltaproteobacteria bacterium]|nr:biliverdin-producing heme oxygenase [Deltaproteobacteria bacterium]